MTFNKPESIYELILAYDAFIIDLWGVMHDGSKLYPGAKDFITQLREQNKQVIYLSNAPRKASKAVETLDRLGIEPKLYDQVITSGQVAHDMLAKSKTWGLTYYYLGPGKDEDILQGLHYQQTDDPAEANFILNTGFEYDYQPEAEIEPTLAKLLEQQLPLLCVNPDLEVVKQDGTQLLCAGWVANRYRELGGDVTLIGKPYGDVYDVCISQFKQVPQQRILAIGDNLLTDILGANNKDIDCLLLTGGILKSEHGKTLDDDALGMLCDAHGARPTYVATSLGSLL